MFVCGAVLVLASGFAYVIYRENIDVVSGKPFDNVPIRSLLYGGFKWGVMLNIGLLLTSVDFFREHIVLKIIVIFLMLPTFLAYSYLLVIGYFGGLFSIIIGAVFYLSYFAGLNLLFSKKDKNQ
ncbi:hypothetical protein NO2_0636 [Candidatus Termititenax persephonae]|uniref:Uncharacterized protein n=1 Tax=Candidatus Termititenax persephonae TaxID=2218525 RepID=A0A388TI70_9BACT|nr:hypothetical protein NO2_0636 [Candidatus Termititenax persephonae]